MTNTENTQKTHECDCISRQDAIDYCYALINAENPSDPSDEWNYSQERINQTEVILHHLEVMPPAQPEPCENVVSREDVQSIAERSDWFESSDSFNDFLLALYALPSAQPDLSGYSDKLWRNAYERGRTEAQAEIVRCRECVYWIAHDKRCVYLNHGFAPNMWCCHGRRTDEKENI